MINKIKRKYKSLIKIVGINIDQIYFSFVQNKVECNICGYKANQLESDSWHLFTVCKKCRSGVRQRLLWATFQHSEKYNLAKSIKEKRVLHFAPEKTLSNLLRKEASFYKTADFFAQGYYYESIDLNVDISNMHNINDGDYDCVIACDVLEHVIEDKNAIKEVYRILSNNGLCFFTVPQKDNLKTTQENLSDLSKTEREEMFGQYDHWRIYGEDFIQLMEQNGFIVSIFDENSFKQEIAIKNVLFPPIISNRKNATNYRKVFVGSKI